MFGPLLVRHKPVRRRRSSSRRSRAARRTIRHRHHRRRSRWRRIRRTKPWGRLNCRSRIHGAGSRRATVARGQDKLCRNACRRLCQQHVAVHSIQQTHQHIRSRCGTILAIDRLVCHLAGDLHPGLPRNVVQQLPQARIVCIDLKLAVRIQDLSRLHGPCLTGINHRRRSRTVGSAASGRQRRQLSRSLAHRNPAQNQEPC